MSPVLEHLKPHLDKNVHALLTALVAAMSFGYKVSDLNDFPVWQRAELIELD